MYYTAIIYYSCFGVDCESDGWKGKNLKLEVRLVNRFRWKTLISIHRSPAVCFITDSINCTQGPISCQRFPQCFRFAQPSVIYLFIYFVNACRKPYISWKPMEIFFLNLESYSVLFLSNGALFTRWNWETLWSHPELKNGKCWTSVWIQTFVFPPGEKSSCSFLQIIKRNPSLSLVLRILFPSEAPFGSSPPGVTKTRRYHQFSVTSLNLDSIL